MNFFDFFSTKILSILEKLNLNSNTDIRFTVEIPKNPNYGDLSTNVAMVYAKTLNKTPLELAEIIKAEIVKFPEIEKVELVKPAFINLYIKNHFWQQAFLECIAQGENFGKTNIGKGEKINIEFVSANPTGPLHIGHARGAVIGDVLASIYKYLGYNVTREYWINDAGSQITTLGKSLYFRYLEQLGQQDKFEKSAEFYPGEYLVPVAKKIVKEDSKKWVDAKIEEWLPYFKKVAIAEMMLLIKEDLATLGIKHDVFSSELEIANDAGYKTVLAELTKKELIYKGTLGIPKGKAATDFQVREQVLFKSTEFDDDEDRALEKSNGERTYFAGDVIYHYNKINRGFSRLINILGADHIGYLKRLTAVVKALSNNTVPYHIIFTQLVNILENGKPLRMSKRAGNFIVLQDLIHEVGKDILRFMMITRKHGVAIDLDLTKIKEQSNDNPVFYIQYAYARINSVLENAKKEVHYNGDLLKQAELSLLNDKAEIDLMKNVLKLPRVLESTLAEDDPHKIYLYLMEVTKSFHHLWNKGKENESLRFIIPTNQILTIARLSLLLQTSIIIKSMLQLLGINIKEKM